MFGSNEEMLAKLQAGGSGWRLFVPTNYTISTYKKLGIIEPLDMAQAAEFRRRPARTRASPREGTIDGIAYAVPKNWGTTGFAVNTGKLAKPMTSWKEFWDIAMAEATAAPWCTTTS